MKPDTIIRPKATKIFIPIDLPAIIATKRLLTKVFIIAAIIIALEATTAGKSDFPNFDNAIVIASTSLIPENNDNRYIPLSPNHSLNV